MKGPYLELLQGSGARLQARFERRARLVSAAWRVIRGPFEASEARSGAALECPRGAASGVLRGGEE